MLTSIILFIVSILLCCITFIYVRNTHKLNENIDEQNKKLNEQNKDLQKRYNENRQNLLFIESEIINKKANLNNYKNQLNDIQNNISKTIDNQKELSQKAFENYCEILNKQYEEAEGEYALYKDAMETSYSNRQLELMQELNVIQKDLDKIKATRTAALKAQLKEKEIKDKLSFYCLKINQNDLDDIKTLDRMKSQLHNPRILNMLIWKTYFIKPMTTLCNNILGTDIVCGIYKITNQLNDMCYIGQSVNISDRFKQHAKCGLGIDTPSGNKLYQAMIEDGLWNFSFELLEECPREQLNEKERYYIDLYQSEEFGYNSNKGINT